MAAAEIYPERVRVFINVSDITDFEKLYPLARSKLVNRFDEEIIRKYVPRDAKKIFFSGSAIFNNKIGDYLESVGFNQKKFYFV